MELPVIRTENRAEFVARDLILTADIGWISDEDCS